MTQNLHRLAGVAMWRQIADALAADISAGRLAPGERLATEFELAERFAVNRHTLRRAMAELADQGLLRIEQGRGTFVNQTAIDYTLGKRTRFSENLLRQRVTAGHRLLSVETAVAPPNVAADLAIPEQAPIIRLETLGVADGVPISYAIHSLALPRFAAIGERLRELGSLTDALAACGVPDYARKVTRLLARPPTEREALHLDQSLARPVLQTEAVNIDPNGVPTHHTLAVFAGDRVQMIVEPGSGTD